MNNSNKCNECSKFSASLKPKEWTRRIDQMAKNPLMVIFQRQMSPAVDNKSETILNGDATEVSSGSVAPSTKHSQPSKKLCLPIQAVIHEYHMKHGLRHQDFFRFEINNVFFLWPVNK